MFFMETLRDIMLSVSLSVTFCKQSHFVISYVTMTGTKRDRSALKKAPRGWDERTRVQDPSPRVLLDWRDLVAGLSKKTSLSEVHHKPRPL